MLFRASFRKTGAHFSGTTWEPPLPHLKGVAVDAGHREKDVASSGLAARGH
jgi:hypothetical protein